MMIEFFLILILLYNFINNFLECSLKILTKGLFKSY
jgi:hypothetical protein